MLQPENRQDRLELLLEMHALGTRRLSCTHAGDCSAMENIKSVLEV